MSEEEEKAKRAEYMRNYRKKNPAYETGGPKRDPNLDRSKPTPGPGGVKNDPDYHKQYRRWERDQKK